MPTLNGLSAGQRIKELMPKVKLIYLTMHLDADLAAQAVRLGASGYVVKNSAATELLRAIRQVLRGQTFITPLLTKDLVVPFTSNVQHKKSGNNLTLRQTEVLQLLAEGRSMKEVAFRLQVSPRTVAFHKYSMMDHLQIKTSAELIQFAVKHSIVSG
jgi:DNA-binding NarL/FixJ family response regulator